MTPKESSDGKSGRKPSEKKREKNKNIKIYNLCQFSRTDIQDSTGKTSAKDRARKKMGRKGRKTFPPHFFTAFPKF
ncbi:MAG: hypothetical protein K6G15_06490 [Desulfovibrio sp.]|nr:hypothetical protein [Desulfovibrio sp.]